MVKLIGKIINLIGRFHLSLASKFSYLLFSTPLKGKLKPKNLPEFLKKAKINSNQVGKLTYASYEWLGNANKVLLIHGWESNSSRWENLIKQFSVHQFSIFALDAPAHGLSGGKRFNVFDHAQCIEDFQEKHQIPFVVGHSIGGTSVMYYLTHTNQQVVKKVVILGAPSEFESLISNYANSLRLNTKIYQFFINFLNEKYKYPVLNFSIAEFCKTLNIQGKIFHDEHDEVVSIKQGQLIKDNWLTSDLEITQGLGHSMQDEKVHQQIVAYFCKNAS